MAKKKNKPSFITNIEIKAEFLRICLETFVKSDYLYPVIAEMMATIVGVLSDWESE